MKTPEDKSRSKEHKKRYDIAYQLIKEGVCQKCILYKTCWNCGSSSRASCGRKGICGDAIFWCFCNGKCTNHLTETGKIMTHYVFKGDNEPTKIVNMSDDIVEYLEQLFSKSIK